MMYRILFIMLLSLSLFGSELEYALSGTVNLSTQLKNDTKLVNGKVSNTKNTIAEIVINNDFYYNKSKLVISPALNKTSQWTYNNVIKKEIPKVELWNFNELYFTQGDVIESEYGNISLSVGLFSFRRGTFYEHNYNGTRVGNGLFSNMDIMLQGYLVTHTYGNNTFMIGDLRFEQWFTSQHNRSSTDTTMTYSDYKDSGGLFIMDRYQATDKIFMEFNYYGMDQYVIGKEMLHTDMYGLGLSYDDSEETGRTYYTILTYNETKGNNKFLSPRLNWPINTPSTKFGEFSNTGYSILGGIKQELDQLVFSKDFVIGGEVIYKAPGYHSLLAGNPFSTYSYTDIGYTYNLSVGMHYDKNTLIKLRYTEYNPTKATKYGLSNESTDSKYVPTSIDSSNQVTLEIYYEF